MFLIVRGGELYAPEPLGRKDVLVAADCIVRTADRIDPPAGLEVRTVIARGRVLMEAGRLLVRGTFED